VAAVSFRNVYKSFGAVKVIEGVSLEVADGEFVVIVGPSGCGKTTLLRMLAGLQGVDSGELLIGGKVVNDLAPKERDVAMVFQNYALYPHMSVYDNMAYGLKIRKLPRPEIEQRVRRAAEVLKIGELLARNPSELSGGQRQRVAMGRAIVREPAVFLFDEPLSNLDAKLRVQMRSELLSLHQRLKTTTLYVTHDQVEAMTLAHRMLVLNAGRTEQVGPPLEVYNRPQTEFVAGFIGSPPMNLIPGRIAERGQVLAAAGEGRVRLPAPLPALEGREVLLGVRPEHLAACEAPAAQLTAAVDFVELLGSDSLVYAHLGAGDGATPLAARLHAIVAKGGQLALGFRAEHVHLFDPQSGRRIEFG
jgi:sn-glycerol 3-phosphate transport system ATP-binding protein